ncbi:MAG TPA: hypothetical protein VNF73_15395 [Candidatus Saccharimonadales bacterium]|nr:hypothetical protein [Candidatus Saccharimonadales bacterium]
MSAQGRAPRSPFGLRSTLASGIDAGGRELMGSFESHVGSMSGRSWLTFILLAAAQLTDLFTFGMAVDRFGPAGELGPLGLVYREGGFWAVALIKMGLIAVVLGILTLYPWQRAATPRRLALIVAAIGVFGAFTNVAAWL